MKIVRLPLICLLACWTILLAGCGNPDRLVVYADPWMGDYAERITAAFQASHPDTDIQLKLLSSEVVAQHIRYGQPVDVFICFGSEFLQQPDFRARVQAETVLAGTEIVFAENGQDQKSKQVDLGTRGCYMLEASDRPMRRYVDRIWQNQIPADNCVLIANFPQQAAAYVLRGWANYFFVPTAFMAKHRKLVAPLGLGTEIPDAFSAILLDDAPNPALAREFFDFMGSEKSKQILAELKFLP